VARFPRHRIGKLLRLRFGTSLGGADSPIEHALDDRHLFVSLGWNDQLTEQLAWFASLADGEGLDLFDPQREKTTAADEAILARLETEARREALDGLLANLLTRAEAGDAGAMNEIGNCYSSGEGAPTDLPTAFTWYAKAAAAGFLPAVLNLAECYRSGEGVEKDARRAAELYRQAFDSEQCVSAYALGEMHRLGEGVEHSLEKAAEFFTIARANRHPEAYVALKRIGLAPSE
jgi:TPR repeat protein